MNHIVFTVVNATCVGVGVGCLVAIFVLMLGAFT